MRTRILDFRFGLIDLEGVIFNRGILYRREFGRFLQGRYNISAKEALVFYQALKIDEPEPVNGCADSDVQPEPQGEACRSSLP